MNIVTFMLHQSPTNNKLLIIFIFFISLIVISFAYFLNTQVRTYRSQAKMSIGLVRDFGEYDPTTQSCIFHGSTVAQGEYACFEKYKYQCTSQGMVIPDASDTSCATSVCDNGQRGCSTDGRKSWICTNGTQSETECDYGCSDGLCRSANRTCNYLGEAIPWDTMVCYNNTTHRCTTSGLIDTHIACAPQCAENEKGCTDGNKTAWSCSNGRKVMTQCQYSCVNGSCVDISPTPFVCHVNGKQYDIGEYICISNVQYQCRTTGVDPVGGTCTTSDTTSSYPVSGTTPCEATDTACETRNGQTTGYIIACKNGTFDNSTRAKCPVGCNSATNTCYDADPRTPETGGGGWQVPSSCNPTTDVNNICVYENQYTGWEYICGYSSQWGKYRYCPNGCSGGCH